jgi:hypothetical protein
MLRPATPLLPPRNVEPSLCCAWPRLAVPLLGTATHGDAGRCLRFAALRPALPLRCTARPCSALPLRCSARPCSALPLRCSARPRSALPLRCSARPSSAFAGQRRAWRCLCRAPLCSASRCPRLLTDPHREPTLARVAPLTKPAEFAVSEPLQDERQEGIGQQANRECELCSGR